jgi:DNA polymerase (family X)
LAEVDMRTEIPAGTLELFTVPGLRPDKALKLYKELGISSVEDLERAAKQERLKDVNGLGSALQSKILQGIEIKRRGDGKRHLHRAAALLELAQARCALGQGFRGLHRLAISGEVASSSASYRWSREGWTLALSLNRKINPSLPYI